MIERWNGLFLLGWASLTADTTFQIEIAECRLQLSAARPTATNQLLAAMLQRYVGAGDFKGQGS